MEERERREKGAAKRRATLGDAYVDRVLVNADPLTAEFQELITRYAWGEVWSRPGLDERARRVLVIGTLLALGRWDEFKLHVRAAIEQGGFTGDDVKEVLLQQAIYCGVPAANTAFGHVREVLSEIAARRGGA